MILIVNNLFWITVIVSFYIFYRKNIFPSKINKILRELLSLSIRNPDEDDPGFNGYRAIIEILKKHYGIDYCTIFEASEADIRIIGTNVNSLYKNAIKAHVAEKIKGIKGDAEIDESRNGLSYESADKRDIKYSYLIPLKIGNKIDGALFFENKAPFKFDKELFLLIVDTINLVLENFKSRNQLMDLAMKDQLTRVYNRNYMRKHLNSVLRQERTFTLAIADIDHFKSVNDMYGHNSGDIVLKTISSMIQEGINDEDRVYRFGGEEFLIYLHRKTSSESYAILDSIRKEIEKSVIYLEEGKILNDVTISFGIHQYAGEEIDNAIKKADKALYFSKENGRNRITKYSDLNEV